MLNRKEKKVAIERMNEKNLEVKMEGEKVVKKSTELFESRQALKKRVDRLWHLIDEFRNKPTYIEVQLKKVKIEYSRYASLVNDIKVSSEQANIKAGVTTGGGIATGIGVAATGPSIAMAVATTFGTASTGTAISTLSGAAATNAALAWLGGGALAAEGGGMAAGSSFLALAGPVGWGIAAIGLTTGGALMNSKNKRLTKNANEATRQLADQLHILEGSLEEVVYLIKGTNEALTNTVNLESEISQYDRNYASLSEDNKFRLGGVVNDVSSYAKLLNKNVGEEK